MNDTQLGSSVFYREHQFNPVPIDVEKESVWQAHFAKRRNLYERHLGIPLSLLRGRSVLEFGCNSGENSLVLASVGASLTLVEPNEHALPRLRALFKRFGLEDRMVELVETDIGSFNPQRQFDMVIAEGFLYALPNRDEMLEKICGLLVSGGLGVISFVDRYGSLLEMTKRMLLWRGCQLLGVDDLFSEDSLEVAKQLFYQDFSEINVSRPFDVWWKDQLVSPFAAGPCVWSFSELLPVVEMSGCEFYSSSPQWNSSDHYQWYKNVSGNETRSENILAHWSRVFPYICTGMQPSISGVRETPGEVVDAVGELVAGLSAFSQDYARPIQVMAYPPKLSRYFAGLEDSRLSQFNTEMDNLYQVAVSGDWDDLLSAYQGSRLLRSLWGTPFHYVCFTKSPADISH